MCMRGAYSRLLERSKWKNYRSSHGAGNSLCSHKSEEQDLVIHEKLDKNPQKGIVIVVGAKLLLE